MNLDLFELNDEEKKERQRLSPYNIEFFINRLHALISDKSISIDRLNNSRNRFYEAHFRISQANIVRHQAVSAYIYHMSRSVTKNDSYHKTAQILAHTYIEYVPLLIYTVDESLADGLLMLYELGKNHQNGEHEGNEKGRLARVKSKLKQYHPQKSITKLLDTYFKHEKRKEIRDFRNQWVHNRMPRIESTFWQPLYSDEITSGTVQEGAWTWSFISSKPQIKYTFESLALLLNEVIYITAQFADACFDEWEKDYRANKL